MDYKWHYDSLISRARERSIKGYVERHHVIPKCMGGTDASDNIVRLTAREHFVAHQLLVKMFPEQGGLICAVRFLTASNSGIVKSNRMYEWLRKRHAIRMSIQNSGRKMTYEQIAKSQANRRRNHSEETKRKISQANKGRTVSDEARANLKTAKLKEKIKREELGLTHHNSGRKQSDEFKKNVSLFFSGRKQTPEQILKRTLGRLTTIAVKKNLASLI